MRIFRNYHLNKCEHHFGEHHMEIAGKVWVVEKVRIDLDYTAELLRTQIAAYVMNEVSDRSTGLGSNRRDQYMTYLVMSGR